MSSSSSSPTPDVPTKQAAAAPPAMAILIVYTILGGLISLLAGREPGTLPENPAVELAPAIIVICGFLVSYSLFDVMAVGQSKVKHNVWKSFQDLPDQMPEEVYLAIRVQTNQVEQMPVFLVGTISCALLVNGTVAAVLALGWSILRRLYASAYRGAVGKKFLDIGLGSYTIPAYFLVNSMLMASVVHSLRAIYGSS